MSQNTEFTIHNKATAPAGSREALDRLEKAVGGIPNLAGAMAESPVLLDGFVTLREIIQKESAFSPVERELLFLTNASVNSCGYCQAIHSTFASKQGLSQADIDAVRAGRPLGDTRQNALVSFTRSVVKERGHLRSEELKTFFAAGFGKSQALEVIACLAQSVMANYTNHFANVEPDEFIKPQYKAAS